MSATTNRVDVNHNSFESVHHIADFIKTKTKHRPRIGIICGTGLGSIAEEVHDAEHIHYSDIPGFPRSTVHGHKGRLVLGNLQGKPVVCMQGRFHIYEGYDTEQCTLPVRVMKLLGVKTLVVTNAAGGLSDHFAPGDFMILKDHVFLPGFAGNSPLKGPNDERFGPRFPGLNNAYDRELRKLALKIAAEVGVQAHEGVYAMMGGPQFETPAENRFLKLVGVDAVGMSTCHETIVARHAGIKVLGISLISNRSEMDSDADHADGLHEEVLDMGEKRGAVACRFVSTIVAHLPDLESTA